MRVLIISLALTGCVSWGDPCWEVASTSLGGNASLTTADGTLAPTAFAWTGDRPEDASSSFEFDFGDARLTCFTTALGRIHGRVLLSSLESQFTNRSACQIVVGTESSLDWTGGTITVTKHDGDTYDVRLDAAPTEVSDVTIELDGLTGTVTFEPASCGGSGGWWL